MTSLLDGWTPWPEEFVDRYWLSGHWHGFSLDQVLRDRAVRYGPRTALVHGDTRLTYAALNRRVDRAAAGFRLRGVGPRARVVVQLPNVPELVVTVFALVRAGALPVLCPPAYRTDEVARLVRGAEAVGYVGPTSHDGFDHGSMAAEIAAGSPFLRRVFTLDRPGESSPYGGLTTDTVGCHYFPLHSVDAPPVPALVLAAGQPALLLVADAETQRVGGPRLVPRTHNDLVGQALTAAEAVALTEDDVYLAALPVGSASGLASPGVIGTLAAGGTVVLTEHQEPSEYAELAAREGVTVAAVERDADVAPLLAGGVRWVQVVGGLGPGSPGSPGSPGGPGTAGPVGAARRVRRVLAPATGPVLLTPPGAADGEPGGPLTALSADDELRVVDAEGAEVPDGEPGELLARGPYTPRGFYRSPDADARAFTPDGRLRTGLLVRRTPTGSLELTGRVAEAPGGA
ncbi:AMP-binding protein [Streptomyces sp. NPDC090025]|uniref:AMP-binding protein n=1 Tax=Streptomyces sp. NPDC090025 TaxID=3365922 RepID=UPI0038326969